MPEDRKLNWREACELLGCKKSRFYNLVRAGKIPAYRIGEESRCMWVWESDCLALVRKIAARVAGRGK